MSIQNVLEPIEIPSVAVFINDAISRGALFWYPLWYQPYYLLPDILPLLMVNVALLLQQGNVPRAGK